MLSVWGSMSGEGEVGLVKGLLCEGSWRDDAVNGGDVIVDIGMVKIRGDERA